MGLATSFIENLLLDDSEDLQISLYPLHDFTQFLELWKPFVQIFFEKGQLRERRQLP